ncbi:hypothetical protein PF006_g17279 [Phytophthora fragariae]|uniref:Uncharacterized protein n=2 Tax=Phytophthora TaxID=4783 RepID=A0A6A3SV68_9STRA|nr:hypothetical protein PF006_g17279 [Phytophthora fragariae]
MPWRKNSVGTARDSFRSEEGASRGRGILVPRSWLLRAGAEVLGESPPSGDSGVLKETPRHWSPYGASDNPPKISANVTLKLDVLLLAFGPKAKEM